MGFKGFTIGVLTTALATGSGVAVAEVAAPTPVGASNLVSVRVLSCDVNARQVLFRAAMRRVRGTHRMVLKLAVLERLDGQRWHLVRAPGLSAWRRSRTGVVHFAYRQRVRGLREGSYRARVDFRWIGAGGKLLRSARRSSPDCITSSRPNLRVIGLGAVPTATGASYGVRVRNIGRGASPATDVALALDGTPAATAPVPALEPGASTVVSIDSRRCARRIRAAVDASRSVLEVDEHDNVLVAPCRL